MAVIVKAIVQSEENFSYLPTKFEPGNMASKLILRFDIDTISCVKMGVPSLLRFAERNQLPLSFFANLGRSVNWGGVLQSRLTTKVKAPQKAASLSVREKLGWKSLVKTVLLDPEVGSVGASELKLIEKDHHDLGLHGGRNHSAWHHGALGWPVDRLRDEVTWGLRRMSSIGLLPPSMFASPGFTHPVALPAVLKEFGFKLLADSHSWGESALNVNSHHDELLDVTTGMLGEPGGVGFVEYLIASGVSENSLKSRLASFIEADQVFIMYDHPCFGGGAGLPMLQAIVNCWRSEGGQFCSLSDLYR